MKLKDGGRPGNSRPIRSSARPDSVVVGTSVVASRPPWAISHSDGITLSERDRDDREPEAMDEPTPAREHRVLS